MLCQKVAMGIITRKIKLQFIVCLMEINKWKKENAGLKASREKIFQIIQILQFVRDIDLLNSNCLWYKKTEASPFDISLRFNPKPRTTKRYLSSVRTTLLDELTSYRQIKLPTLMISV